jgi:hypothetical protein
MGHIGHGESGSGHHEDEFRYLEKVPHWNMDLVYRPSGHQDQADGVGNVGGQTLQNSPSKGGR